LWASCHLKTGRAVRCFAHARAQIISNNIKRSLHRSDCSILFEMICARACAKHRSDCSILFEMICARACAKHRTAQSKQQHVQGKLHDFTAVEITALLSSLSWKRVAHFALHMRAVEVSRGAQHFQCVQP
jgi:hypothetical protein